FATPRLIQEGPDRVRIHNVSGSAPPDSLKVAINLLGGYRNSVTMVITGPAIDEKARWAETLLFDELGGKQQFDSVDVHLARFDKADAPTEELAGAHLRVSVKDAAKEKVGRRFSNAATGLYLGGYAGFHTLTPPMDASAFGIYWPTTVPISKVSHTV